MGYYNYGDSAVSIVAAIMLLLEKKLSMEEACRRAYLLNQCAEKRVAKARPEETP